MLEPRLYPLLETLTRADLDWLTQEIISGALTGRVREESPETLQAERDIVSRRAQDTGKRMPVILSEERPEAFSGDEQIEWAAQHVVQRLEQILEMLRLAIDHLDEVTLGEDSAAFLKQTDTRLALVVQDGEAVNKIDREQLTAAIKGLGQLRDALGTWAAEARRGE